MSGDSEDEVMPGMIRMDDIERGDNKFGDSLEEVEETLRKGGIG